MSNFFDTATLIFAFVWVICMGASFIAVLDWDGIIEAKRLKLLVPAAIVAQMFGRRQIFLPRLWLQSFGNQRKCLPGRPQLDPAH